MNDEEILKEYNNFCQKSGNDRWSIYGELARQVINLMSKAREDERKNKCICLVCGTRGLGKSKAILYLAEASQQERERVFSLFESVLEETICGKGVANVGGDLIIGWDGFLKLFVKNLKTKLNDEDADASSVSKTSGLEEEENHESPKVRSSIQVRR